MSNNSSSLLVSSLIIQPLCIDHGNPYWRWTGTSGSLVRQTANTAELRPSMPGLCLKPSPYPQQNKKVECNQRPITECFKDWNPHYSWHISLFQVSDSTIILLSQTLNCLSKPDNVECSLTLKRDPPPPPPLLLNHKSNHHHFWHITRTGHYYFGPTSAEILIYVLII